MIRLPTPSAKGWTCLPRSIPRSPKLCEQMACVFAIRFASWLIKIDVLQVLRRVMSSELFIWDLFLHPRIHAMYQYDHQLFAEKWLGPPGVLGPQKNLQFPTLMISQLVTDVVILAHLPRHWNTSGMLSETLLGFRTTRSCQIQILVSVKVWDNIKSCFNWFTELCLLSHKEINLQYVFPIIVHGDDADVHRRRSFCAVTIGTPFADGRSSWDCKFLTYIVDVNKMLPESFDTLDAWMVYGLMELQEGRFFDVDIYDKPYARGFVGSVCGPYRGVLVALKGDQKFLQRALKLTTSWNSERVCMYCGATSAGHMLYCAFGPGAPHRNTLVTTVNFMQHGCKPNSWIRLPGWDLELVLADWLHIVDLAITPEMAASVTSTILNMCLFVFLKLFVALCLLWLVFGDLSSFYPKHMSWTEGVGGAYKWRQRVAGWQPRRTSPFGKRAVSARVQAA